MPNVKLRINLLHSKKVN